MKAIAIFLLILTASACGGGGADTPVTDMVSATVVKINPITTIFIL